MLLEFLLHDLLTMSQIFNVSPGAEHLCSPDPIVNLLIIGKVIIVKLAVISQKETGEVQGQIRLSLFLCYIES